ncbi:GntR family transcriptional regulator [Bordetella hinzii]|jgi:DNA-binding GntR family transcriptional regulator|uniref:GntR family transcriptional regulator n=2 Tax=Bordetella hinzii TaxID=103855 RepID=A0AAN1RZB2_9BORD|nr:GntR family transcriptional regulator [Bordetella hinzii]AKQ55664.1 HTH-type transcriptional repressor YvoA [Bordetella hinzii]AKQ60167.1 HTH-type transcriptional repressor YvoA [Bordetella hinzii]AZW18753.1 GntR family transcriptional regulator [Bordetella hinzii]KCB21738.1 UbiC transcription regulator-associated domain protein [Bordetella hinzii L60]KCB24562.1 UbiC transcription regulator-associated domain protein [Bordetella hinzii OH87 BAL007II]
MTQNTQTPSPKPTLYQSISDHLLEMIRDGQFPVGAKLPTEMELCEQFGVGRHTAREAVRKLTDLGVVERRRRAGTTVVRQHPRAQFGVELETTNQLQRYLEATDLHVHKRVMELSKMPRETALEGAPSEWFKVETYRCVPGTKRAISWTDIYLRKEYEAVAEHISTKPGGVYPLLEAHCGEIVEVIEMEISASRFPPRVARFLEYEAVDPALLIIRSFRNPAGKLLEVAVSFYPPYEFRYVTRLSRRDGQHKTRS